MFCPHVTFSWSELKDCTYWYMGLAKKSTVRVKRSDEGLRSKRQLSNLFTVANSHYYPS